MNFTISQKSIKDFNSCLRTTQSIYENSDRGSKIFVKFVDNTMYTIISGNGNFVKFKTAVENMKLDKNESPYLAIDLQIFSNLLNKASQVDVNNSVLVDVKGTKVNLRNQNSVYSFQTIGNYEEDDFVDEFSLRERNFSNTFDTAETIKINAEIIDFINIAYKSIKLIGKLSVASGIIIQNDLLKFSDKELSIVSKKMSEKTSDVEKYLPQNIFPTLTSMYSLIGEFDIKLAMLSEHEKYISITTNDDYEFDMILPVPFVACMFPTEEEWAGISAEDRLKYSFKINRNDLLTALKRFEGVFPSATWGFKQIYFGMAKNSDELELSFNDMRTEVIDTVKVSNAVFNVDESKNDGETDSDYEERISRYNYLKCVVSTFSLSGYLEKLCSAENILVEVSPEAPDVDSHGIALCLYSEKDGVRIALAKMLESCI